MVLNPLWDLLEKRVFTIPSTDDLFNQYFDIDKQHDLPNGAQIRRDNLKNYFYSFSEIPKILLIGEAPGKAGCRFSGIPFTSEDQLCNNTLPFTGKQSSNRPRLWREPSAKKFWDNVLPYALKVFIWNAIPIHPHETSACLKNRKPDKEIKKEFYLSLLSDIIAILRPKLIVALGRVPEKALISIEHNTEIKYVRHPSYDRKKEFPQQIKAALSSLCH